MSRKPDRRLGSLKLDNMYGQIPEKGTNMAINGTKHRQSATDFMQRCKNQRCGKVFYFPHDCNGKTVVCPHCGTHH